MDLTALELYAVKAAGIFAVIMLVAIAGVRAHHPFPRFGAANQVTAFRALLAALLAALIGEPPLPMTAIGLATAATALDGVDGWLARRQKTASAFGARFDVEVDAFLILVLASLTWQYDKAGPWVLLSGLLRYVFVAAGWVWAWLRAPLSPTLRGKAICVIQIVGLMVAICPAVPSPASNVVAAATLAALSYSFFADTHRLWRA